MVLDLQNEDEMQLVEYSITKLQASVRLFLCRSKVLKNINERYEKIFDPKRHKYYYYDKLRDRSSWDKPRLLLNKDIEVVAPTYTNDEAATKIQSRIRIVLSLLRVRLIYQVTLITSVDESSGYNYYYNPKSDVTMWDLPEFMNGRLDYEKKKARVKSAKPKHHHKHHNRRSSSATGAIDDDAHSDGDGESSGDENSDEEPGRESVEEGATEDDLLRRQPSDDHSEATGLSEESSMVRERRRLARHYPRSKAQNIVDEGEDHIEETTSLDLSGLGAGRFTSRLYDLDGLTSLNLSGNKLTRVSPDIQYLHNLTCLNLSGNRLETVPKEVEELKVLRDLDISRNQISNYPGQFYKLKKLTSLNLSHNQFAAIPIETGNLELLKDLGQWDVGIGLLTQLTHLDVSHNQLTAWPLQIDLLVSMRHLDLSYNNISLVPSLIGSFVALEHLNLSFNVIHTIPFELYELPRLQFLAIHDNRLPDWAVCLVDPTQGHLVQRNLTDINVSHNNITCIDRRMDVMRYVVRLVVSHNAIDRFIGSAVGDDCMSLLSALNYLDMSFNKITELTNSLGACVSLTFLDLSHNEMMEIPTCFVRLTKLVTINLSHNCITEASGKIFAMLNDLSRLELQHNRLTVLPPLFYTLKKVTYLDISHNQIEVIMDNVQQMVSVTHLNLSFNRIAGIPSSISTLTQLVILELKSNAITALPSSLSCLKLLRRVTLSRNDLRASPDLLSILPQLISSNLSWNEKLAGHSINWVEATSQYDPFRSTSFAPSEVLHRRLFALAEEVDSVTAKIQRRVKKPVYTHEVVSVVQSREEEFNDLKGPTDAEDDDGTVEQGGTVGGGGGASRASTVSVKGGGPRASKRGTVNTAASTVSKKIPKKKKKQSSASRALEWHQQLQLHFKEHLIVYSGGDGSENEETGLQSTVNVTPTEEGHLSVPSLRSLQNRQWCLHIATLLQTVDAHRGYCLGTKEFVDTPSSQQQPSIDAELLETCLREQGVADYQGVIESYVSVLHEVNALSMWSTAKHIAMHDGKATLDWDEEPERPGTGQTVEQDTSQHVPPPQGSPQVPTRRDSNRDSSHRKHSVRSSHVSENSRRATPSTQNKLLTMAFGELTAVERVSGLSKADLMEGASSTTIPPLLHFARWMNCTTSETVNRTSAAVAEDRSISLAFACFVGLSKTLVKRAQCLVDSIRYLEKRGSATSSILDLAQRRDCADYVDVMDDVYGELSAMIAEREGSRKVESLSTRKKNNVSSLMGALLAPEATGGEEVPDEPDTAQDAPTTANERLLNASVDKMMSKDPADTAPVKVVAAPQKTLSEILPPVDKSALVLIEPLEGRTWRTCVSYLDAHRRLTLLWAAQCLDIAGSVLRLNGWDLSSASFRLHNKHQHTGLPDWLREGAIQVCALHAQVCQGLQLYSRALEEHAKVLRLLKKVDCKQVLLEMIKIHLSQGNFLVAKKYLLEIVEDYILKPLNKAALTDILELLRHDKEMALLMHYADISLEILRSSHNVFSPQQILVFGIQDNGLLSMPGPDVRKFKEITFGRRLGDTKKGVASKARREGEKKGLELHESRKDLRGVIATAKENVKAMLIKLAEDSNSKLK